jgi:hypothetical protein
MGWLERILGGPPLAVIAKLVFLSLVVGAILAGLGLSPALLLALAVDAAEGLFGLGFDAIRDVGRYILTGAAIVIPIWLVARLLGGRR